LALFYNWAGTHHLIGGPIPAWLVTVGVVGSLMMIIPVTTVAINHHMTTKGHFARLRVSPTLRFVVFGAMSYTVVSFQGSLQSVRGFNELSHFTHYTVAHAHLGVYSFFSMIMFGAIYYIAPRLTDREWMSAGLIKVHFWCTALGILVYWVGLSWGGVLQGLMLSDPDSIFLEIVSVTLPYLWSRTLAGVLMTVGHVAFAVLAWNMFTLRGAGLRGPTLFRREPAEAAGGGGP
jgi:cytochrome c oxidase cbb3-type subunit 1